MTVLDATSSYSIYISTVGQWAKPERDVALRPPDARRQNPDVVAFTVRQMRLLQLPTTGALPEPEQACKQNLLLVGALCLAGYCSVTYLAPMGQYDPQMALRKEPQMVSATSSS